MRMKRRDHPPHLEKPHRRSDVDDEHRDRHGQQGDSEGDGAGGGRWVVDVVEGQRGDREGERGQEDTERGLGDRGPHEGTDDPGDSCELASWSPTSVIAKTTPTTVNIEVATTSSITFAVLGRARFPNPQSSGRPSRPGADTITPNRTPATISARGIAQNLSRTHSPHIRRARWWLGGQPSHLACRGRSRDSSPDRRRPHKLRERWQRPLMPIRADVRCVCPPHEAGEASDERPNSSRLGHQCPSV